MSIKLTCSGSLRFVLSKSLARASQSKRGLHVTRAAISRSQINRSQLCLAACRQKNTNVSLGPGVLTETSNTLAHSALAQTSFIAGAKEYLVGNNSQCMSTL